MTAGDNLENAPAAEAEHQALIFPADADDRDTLDKLAGMGFRQPREASATVRRWLAGCHRALKGEFARERLADLVPLLLPQLARSANPDAALERPRRNRCRACHPRSS